MAQDLSSLPTALYTQEQVRAAELLAVSEGEATLYQLVERAGCAAFNYLTEQIVRQPKLGAMPLLVLAGNGNNGADALVCARLALEAGHKVHVFLLKTKGTPEFEQALSAYLNQGGIVDSPNIDAILQAPILIDGLLGTGVQGAVREQVAALIHAINQSNAWVLSLDLPSGILADTGVVAQVAVMADATLCFGGLKQGLLTSKARHHCGHLAFADLGLTPFFNGESATRVGGEILKSYFAARARDSHKGQSGKVTLIGGDFGMAGAIRLASEACLRGKCIST